MKRAVLPGFLRPAGAADLVRLGRDYDGGYLVDRRDVDRADSLIGLGISRDWSFEKDFFKAKPVDVFAYDASLKARDLLDEALKPLPRLHRPRAFLRTLRLYRDYRKFFQGNRRHIQSFVGFDDPPEFIPLSAVFSRLGECGLSSPFLKIDIEGFEYRIIDALLEHAGACTGLVM